MPANIIQTPFLEVRSFLAEEVERAYEQTSTGPSSKPFLSVYELDGFSETGDPNNEAYVTFLNEMYDEEFDEALFELMTEASTIYGEKFLLETEHGSGGNATRTVEQHFAPLLQETEAMLDAMTGRLGQQQLADLAEGEIDAFLDEYRSTQQLTPSFENFFGGLKSLVGKVAKGAVSLAKKGIETVGKLGLGPILKRLKRLIKPLLKRVLKGAIGKLPSNLQPIAKKLAQRLPLLNELEEETFSAMENPASVDVTELQHEFDRQVANLLFAPGDTEQELEVARATSEAQGLTGPMLHDLDEARENFIDELSRLKEGEDPTPHVEKFIPAILPALKLGLRIAGRKRVVGFLAKFVAKLIQKFIGPQYAPALSKAMVDAGLRLIGLEVTPADEARAASSAVAATVEETVRRVASLPEYLLDDPELLEGFALEAFEQAAAANLPPVLSDSVYQQRPDLLEAKGIKGTWLTMPLSGPARYKKFCGPIKIKITPHKAMAVESFDGVTLGEFLQDQLGVPPGVDVEAEMHLFESLPGTTLPEVAEAESQTAGLGSHSNQAVSQLHPLTPQAAGVLLNEPGLGRDASPKALTNRRSIDVGQRFYRLAVPGHRPLLNAKSDGRSKVRRLTSVRITLDFPGNEIRLNLFLSERRAQEIAVKLRKQGHVGASLTAFKGVLDRRLLPALSGLRRGHVKIVHEALSPEQALGGALKRLPPSVSNALADKLKEWLLNAMASFLKQQASRFIAATEDSDDGVTVKFTIQSPPGLAALRQAVKGKMPPLSGLSWFAGSPSVKVDVVPGYKHG